MTENQMHWDLLTQEEYALRRHAGSDMNTNAEGYVNYTLAMNANGVLAVSGYLEYHTLVCHKFFIALDLRLLMRLCNM